MALWRDIRRNDSRRKTAIAVSPAKAGHYD
jgi:hypothetical protein